MKIETNFYLVDESLAKSCAPLLLKILDEKKRAFLFCQKDLMKEIDDGLWTYGRNKFIPHASVYDRDFEAQSQPIVISDQENNLNKAEHLILFAEPTQNFVQQFHRIFYFFESLNKAKELAPKYQSLSASFNCYKKEDSKWVNANKMLCT